MESIKRWRNSTTQLVINIVFKLSAIVTPPAYRNFLVKVLQAIAESDGNPKVIFPLLQANLDKLNKSFCLVVWGWANPVLSEADPKDAEYLAAVLVTFGNLILDLPAEKKADHVEIAIAAYNVAYNVFDREVSLEKAAIVQKKLANAYNNRCYGKQSENQKLARSLFARAIQVLETQPSMYLNRENFMEPAEAAIAFLEKVLQEILQVVSQSFFEASSSDSETVENATPPFNLVNSMGTRLEQRIYPILEANQDQLNDEFAQWLEQWTVTVLPTAETLPPELMAVLLGGFSELLLKFPRGNQASNQEIAIASYQAALSLIELNEESQAELGIGFQVGLSMAYRIRIRGDEIENSELAIEYGEAALRQCTRPEHYREVVQRELGAAYRNHSLLGNHPVEDLRQAIYYYSQALNIITSEVSQKDWALINLNLGNVYADLHWLIRDRERTSSELEESIRLAIDCYENALQGFDFEGQRQERGIVLSNLGSLYLEHIHGNEESRNRAASYFEQALQAHQRRDFPFDWAVTQYSLGLAYRDLHRLPEAIVCFRLALEICQPQAHPLECLRAGRNLGNAASQLGLWNQAIEGYALAIDALEQRRTWATSESRRQEIMETSINVDLYANMVQACVNNRQLEKAMEYVERSRSKRLVDLMTSNDLYAGGQIPQEIQEFLQRYEALQEQIDRLDRPSSSGDRRELAGERATTRAALEARNDEIEALEAEKQQVWERLRRCDPVLAGQIQVSAPNLSAMQQLVDRSSTAILSFYTTDSDTYIFILKQNQIALHTCVGQGRETLQSWISNNWLLFYLSNNSDRNELNNRLNQARIVEERQDLQNQLRELHLQRLLQMSAVLEELAQRLQLDELIASHLEGMEELILIPHLLLHQIPFAALPITASNHIYLGDRFLLRYVPSCQILEFCQRRSPVEDSQNFGTAEDATGDLIFARFEGQQIANLYGIPDCQRLRGPEQATVTNYRRLLQQTPIQLIHSSHHANSRLDNPLESRLVLADGSVTLGQLLTPGWRLPHLFEVFLSCCETNLGLPSLTDDILTLAAGFLCAGARSVVSTLWSVDELATALFSLLYYQQRQRGQTRPEALQKAQIQLRTLRGTDCLPQLEQNVERVVEQELERVEQELEQEFRQAEAARRAARASQELAESRMYAQVATRLRQLLLELNLYRQELRIFLQQEYPFANPYYWAAFTCQGLR